MFLRVLIVCTVLVLWAEGGYYTCPNPKEFSQAFTANVKGDIELIGNTVMCYNDNGECGDPGTDRNNDIDMMYIDIDSDDSTFNSSAAKLEIPPGSEVLWAGLYWQGYLANEDDSTKAQSASIKLAYSPTKTTTPNYQDIAASDHNWIYFSGTRMYYQGNRDITDFVRNNNNGWYYVANITTKEGTPAGGSYGAWSIAIAYKNSDKKLKNLTIFDGYQGVVNTGDEDDANDYASDNGCSDPGVGNTVDIGLSGFLTPTTSSIDSKLFIFAGEGDNGADDADARGDHLQIADKSGTFYKLTNSVNPEDDVFNSTISKDDEALDGEFLSPYNSDNSNGIDIDTFDISDIIDNEQMETTVRLNTNDDGYMPGLFGFSTNIYQPRVCYVQEILNSRAVKVGETVYFNVYITNEPREGETSVETAKGVSILNKLDESILRYKPETIEIENIGETGFTQQTDDEGDDLAEFNEDTNMTTFRLGEGADAENGGSIEEMEYANIRFSAVVTSAGEFDVDNEYYIEYVNALTGAPISTEPVEIEECRDFNTSLVILQPPLGAFNTVHEGADLSNGDPLDGDDPVNDLYTQIGKKDFNVTLVSLDEDFTTLRNFTGNVILELIDASTLTDTQQSCEDAMVLETYYDILEAKENLFNDEATKTVTISHDDVARNVRFRIKYYDLSILEDIYNQACKVSNTSANINGIPQCLNATDNKLAEVFPKCAPPETDVCKSEEQTGDLDWRCYECITGYNAPICSRDNFALRPKEFVLDTQNELPQLAKAGEVYEMNVKAVDNEDIVASQYDQSVYQFDANTTKFLPNGTVDNNLSGKEKILGRDFNVTMSEYFQAGEYENYKVTFTDVGKIKLHIYDKEWADVDSDEANSDYIVTGEHEARWIPFEFKLPVLNMRNHGAGNGFTYLSNDLNMSAKVEYRIAAVNKEGNETKNYSDGLYKKLISFTNSLEHDGEDARFNTLNDVNLSFNDGIASQNLGDQNLILFNFGRDNNTPEEPFIVPGSSFATQIQDEDNVTGNRDQANGQSLFYYGHIYAPDVQTAETKVDVPLYMEVFCQNSADITCSSIGSASEDNINWWQNSQHGTGNGELERVIASQPEIKIEALDDDVTINKDLLNPDSLNFEYTGNDDRYKTRINLRPDPWLSYHKYIPVENDQNFFFIEFNLTPSANWAGEGQTGNTVDENSSIQRHRRIDW